LDHAVDVLGAEYLKSHSANINSHVETVPSGSNVAIGNNASHSPAPALPLTDLSPLELSKALFSDKNPESQVIAKESVAQAADPTTTTFDYSKLPPGKYHTHA
jgi:hypothetical protein